MSLIDSFIYSNTQRNYAFSKYHLYTIKLYNPENAKGSRNRSL